MRRHSDFVSVPPVRLYSLRKYKDPDLGRILLGYLPNGDEILVRKLDKRRGLPQEWIVEKRSLPSLEFEQKCEEVYEKVMMKELMIHGRRRIR